MKLAFVHGENFRSNYDRENSIGYSPNMDKFIGKEYPNECFKQYNTFKYLFQSPDKKNSFYILNTSIGKIEDSKKEKFEQFLKDNQRDVVIFKGITDNLIYLEAKINNYNYSFYLDRNPTNNCQLCSILSFGNILSKVYNDKAQTFMPLFIKKLKNFTSKKIMFFDIKQSYVEKVNVLNPMVLENYTSTNNSQMCIGLINMTKF